MRSLSAVLLAAALLPAVSRAEEEDKPPPVKQVKVTTEDGLVLAADLYEPAKGGEKKPAVVALHAEGGDRSMWKDVAAVFQEHGMSVLAIDVRGHGGSKIQKGTDPKPDDPGTDLSPRVAARDPELFSVMWRDAAAGVKYLRATLLADGTKIAVVGCGACGAAGLDAAARDPKVAAALWIGPSMNNFGAGGLDAVRKWDGRPLGLMTTEKAGRGDFDAIAKTLAKQPRFEAVVVPGAAASSTEIVTKADGAKEAVVQFVYEWVDRPKLTGRTRVDDNSGPGKIVAAQSSHGFGMGAGGCLRASGYEAPAEMEGLVVVACAAPGGSKLPAGARRLTFKPGKGKELCVEVLIEQWSGTAWAKVDARTLFESGGIVLGKDVNTYELLLTPRLLGVKPFTEVMTACVPVVKGKPKWEDKKKPDFPGMKEAAPDNPSTWGKWELR